ncbi:MAG TPA: DUF1150 family protein [Devosiaceae bacterium]|nr:DUF1150 family protein [Devosiaceae bacterium]
MQDPYDYHPEEVVKSHALRTWKEMTLAEFTVLGANALVYIRALKGSQLAILLSDPEFESEQTFQLIVSADGSPLLVTDSMESANEWLEEANLAAVTMH